VAHRVSAIIPAHNEADVIADTIRGAKTIPGVTQIIVVDDGSNPPLPAPDGVLLTLIRQANTGVSAARNRGLSEARGEFVVFLDADDRLLPTAATPAVDALRAQPEAACAVGLCRVINADGSPAPFRQRGAVSADTYRELLSGNFVWMPGQVTFRRSLLGDRPFDSSVDACADYDLYLRLARRHPFVVHDTLVAEYREHVGSMSKSGEIMLRTSLAVLRRQRPFLNDEVSRTAYKAGRRFWREFYGDRVVEEIRAALHQRGRRTRALRASLVLLRYHPAGVAYQLAKKTRLVLTGLWRAARAAPPSSPRPPVPTPPRASRPAR